MSVFTGVLKGLGVRGYGLVAPLSLGTLLSRRAADAERERESANPFWLSRKNVLKNKKYPIGPVADLREIEDRRTWHPLSGRRPAAGLISPRHRLREVAVSKTARIPWAVGFQDAVQVAVCIRRKERKEVLHAIGKVGGGHKRPRYSWYSEIVC